MKTDTMQAWVRQHPHIRQQKALISEAIISIIAELNSVLTLPGLSEADTRTVQEAVHQWHAFYEQLDTAAA